MCKIEKTGKILSFILDNNKTVTVDCTDFTITSHTGCVVKTFPRLVSIEVNMMEDAIRRNNYQMLIKAITYAKNTNCIQQFNYIETFIPVINLLEFPTEWYAMPQENPKGFVKFLIANEIPVTGWALKIFKYFKNLSQIKGLNVNEIAHFCKTTYNIPECNWLLLRMERLNVLEITKFFKMYRKTCKTYPYDLKWIIQKLEGLLLMTLAGNLCEFITLCDANRDLLYNIETVEEILLHQKHTVIIENESKLLPLENIQHSIYQVVIPKTLRDFTDEGEQQNNCVGHHYYDSIAEGEDLIYFIRHRNNSKKSYITCCYSTSKKCTVEYRLKNNKDVNLLVDINFIHHVDIYIREILKTD